MEFLVGLIVGWITAAPIAVLALALAGIAADADRRASKK